MRYKRCKTIERFITGVARKKNADYLRFSPDVSLSLPPKRDNRPVLMYLHVPFCEELCPYCSFNRMVFREDLARSYFEALRAEIIQYRDLGYAFEAIYVGGGTPTVLIDELSRTLELARNTYPIKEISVETNPNHLVPDVLRQLKDNGVNRLSVGVQTFDDPLLQQIERYHKYGSGEQITRGLAYTQGIFDTLNVDMIFNFPSQTREALERDLGILVDLGVDQVTYYPLMVSDSTRKVMNEKMGIVDYDRGMDLYFTILDALIPGYRASTAWCFSKKESVIDEYVVNFGEYAGLGSGSIGYLEGSAYANTFDVHEYISRIRAGKSPVTAKRVFSLKERMRYDFLMKLFGIKTDIGQIGGQQGVSAYRYLWPEIVFFTITGALKRKGNTLMLTPKGQYYWVIMMREFFIGVNNFRDYCRALIKEDGFPITEKM